MAFVDPVFEQRRAQILGRTPGGTTTPPTSSGTTFIDPTFEQRRKEIMSQSRPTTQSAKKVSTTPIQVNKPTQPSVLDQIGQRITSNAQWVGQQVNQNIGEPIRKISKDVTLKIVQPTIRNIEKALPEPIQQTIQQNTQQKTQQPIEITPGQKKLTQQQLTKVAPQTQPQNVQQKVAGQSAVMKPITSKDATTYQSNIAKNFLSNIGEQFSKEYPGSAQSIQNLMKDPLSLKANIGKTVGSVADALISPWISAYKAQIETYKPSSGVLQTTARDLALTKAKADILFSPASAFFAGIDNVPIVASLAKIVALPYIFVGESAPQITNRLIDKLPISEASKKELKPAVSDVFGLALQLATGHFMAKAMSKPASLIKKYGADAFRSATKIITENSNNSTVVYNLSPSDVKNVATIGNKPLETRLITDLNLSKEAWKNATQHGLSIEVTPDQLVGVIDKPYWAKIKSLFKIKPTDTTEVIPGSAKVRGSFAGYLTDGERTPQEVAGEVIKNNLQNTPEGKAIMQTVAEAQKAGQNIIVEKKTPTVAEIKARAEQLKAQNQANGVVGTGDQAEINAGWKVGQKAQFDLALDNKDVASVKKLLPNVPEYYKAQVADKITTVIGNTKTDIPLVLPKVESQLENIKPNAVVKVDKQPLYRGTNVDGQALVEKADKTWEKVLEIETNQAELIKQLADQGNKDAMKLIENSPNPEKVEFVQADPIIQKAIGESFDAIKYKNNTPALKAQGETYYDLATGQSFAQLEETARMYARSSARKEKYTPPKEPVVQEKAVQIKDEAPSVISYIDKQGNKVYTKLTQAEFEILKDEVKNIPDAPQGESQIHLNPMNEKLIARGYKEINRNNFISGHSQVGQVFAKTNIKPKEYRNSLDKKNSIAREKARAEEAKNKTPTVTDRRVSYDEFIKSSAKAQGEKNGRNLMEIENSDLTLPELKKKLEIAIEGKEDQWLIDLIKKDIEARNDFTEETKILRGTKGMTADDIMKTYPNIQLKKDVPATDVYGNKKIIPEGEKLTPYELKGNKILLQDGETYIVTKNQFQNIKGQSKTAEGKPFAPELEGLEETVMGIGETNGEIAKKMFNKEWNSLNEAEKKEVTNYMRQSDAPSMKPTKYSQYTLPGGENYREILIKTKPNEELANKPMSRERFNELNDMDSPYTGYEVYLEAFDKNETVGADAMFKSSHWEDLNVIAHLRMNDRTYNGDKVAFMEELQSDWAREGRSKGFKMDDPSSEIKEANELFKKYGWTKEMIPTDPNDYSAALDELSDKLYEQGLKGGAEQERIGILSKSIYEKTLGANMAGKVPFNENLKNWQELTIKRALKEAVNSNAEYFAWINGEQTSNRYNLATQVESVKWNKYKDNTGDSSLIIKPKSGLTLEFSFNEKGEITSGKDDWKGKKLDEVLGKGLADKIMADESGTLSGEGLKFGGEWANTLYDKQVKNIVEDLTGGKVEEIDMGLPVDSKVDQFYNTNKNGLAGTFMKPEQIEVGKIIKTRMGNKTYIITDILGDGKFKAISTSELFDMTGDERAQYISDLRNPGQYEKRLKQVVSNLKISQLLQKNGEDSRDWINKQLENRKRFLNINSETFDITQKTTKQQALKLTPEIKARIKGEAPVIETSGKQFEDKPQVQKTTYTRGDIGKIQAQIDEILGIDPGIKNFRMRQRIFQENYSITAQAADAGFPQAQDDLLKIANLTAELERLRGIKNAKKAPTGEGFADVGGYADVESSKKALENLKSIEFPELTRMVTALMGEAPTLKFFKRALGKFYPNIINPNLTLNPEIFNDVKLVTKVLAHELGHLIDFLPDNTLKRGNILGRIATLKRYMSNFISEEPGGGGEITPKDRARLRKEAERLSKIPVEVETEIVIGENKATPEQILAIWNDTNAPEKYPELLDYIQSLSASQKIEIVKEAMKQLLPTWMDFKMYSKERVITQVIQDAPEDIRRRYEELIKQEIEKRQLFSNQEIRAELKALSMLWKPFDPTANEAMTKYRYSSVELYADALSVLFNDPDLLKEKAPQFYKGFFNYLDNKPEVKQVYTDMQILLEKGEDAVNDARLNAMYEGFEEGKQKRTEIENKVQPQKSWIERFMFNHITKFHPIYKILNKKTGNDPESNNQKVREALEEWQMRHQDQHEFARAVADDIVMPLNKIGLTEQDFGVVLKLEREAIGDRMQLANPGGLIGEIPVDVLKRFYEKKKMTQAQIKVFEQIKQRFHDLVFAEAERASLNGNYDPVVFEEKIRPNKDTYATFGVIDYIDKNYISAGIKKQVGTLKDIENPLVSTILKTMSLIEWNNTQEAKLVATQALLDDSPEDITEARPIKDSGGKTIKFKKEENREVLELMRMGKRIGYNVDPYIKRMFDNESMTPNEIHALVAVTRGFNRVFKPIVTTYKPGWAFWSNIVRDQKRTYINLGSALNKFAEGKKGLSIAELLTSYISSLPEGVRFVKEERTALIKEMLENKALSTPWISYDPYANNDGDIGFILRKYKVLGKEQSVHIVRKIFDKSFGKFLQALQFAGSVGEATSKISGYKIAKSRGIEGRRLGFITRNYVGTPNYMEGGAWKQIDNDVFVFSNIMAQATRVSAELATDPQTRSGYWWRTFKLGILPKLLMAGALAGLFGEKVKDAYEKMTEYDKTNYITIPVGFEENRKAVYLRIPMDETERFLGALVWKIASTAVQGKIVKPEQVASLGAGYLPSLTPLFDIVGRWVGYAQGRNPYDSFRGRLAIDDLSWKAGGMIRLKKMVMYTLNEAGIANFKTYDTSNISTTETMVQGIPIINRMFQVSDYGLSEKYTNNMDQEQAQKSLRKNELVNKYVQKSRSAKTEGDLTKVRTEMIKEYFGGLPKNKDEITEGKALSKKFMIQREKGSSVYLDKLIYSNLNDEKFDYLLQFQKDMSKSDFKALVNDALKYKIISKEILLRLKANDSRNK